MAKRGRKSQPPEEVTTVWGEQRQREERFLKEISRSWTLEGILQDLGIGIELRFAKLLEMLRYVRGKFTSLDALREAILEADDITKWKTGDFLAARAEDRLPTLDEIIDWKDLSRIEIAGSLAAASFIMGIDTARGILGGRLPEIVTSATELAINGEGMVQHLSQKMLMEAGGMMPKGPNTVVNVNQTNNTLQVGLPKWDETDKLVSKAYFDKVEPRGLPPAQMENIVEAEFVEVKEPEYANAT